MPEIFKGDVGIDIILSTGSFDITGSSSMKIKYRKPDGTTGSWSASEKTSTSINYVTTLSDDIDQVGFWFMQAYIEKSGKKLSGIWATIEVKERIE